MYLTKTCLHGLIVGDTLGIGAAHNADKLIRHLYSAFLHHLVISYDTEGNIGSYGGKLIKLFVCKISVSNLDNALASHVSTLEVEAHSNSGLALTQVKHTYNVKKTVIRDMVYDGAVFDGGYE